eukprot:scpid3681/ scgid25031/ Fibrocystin-L; Polycystic kidney and hepatic disease 1-like protein 1; Protein D86
MGHHIPFVTNHKYKVTWGALGLDFETLRVQTERLYLEGDEHIHLVHNHTDTRVAINVTAVAWDGTVEQIDNETIDDFSYNNWKTGYNKHLPNTEDRWFEVAITGDETRDLIIEGQRCWDTCLDLLDNNAISDEQIFWSNKIPSWDADTNFLPPTEGMDVTIKAEWNMVYDIAPEDAVKLGTLTILGRLNFTDEIETHLIADKIVLNRGELIIGEEDRRHTEKATITLTGEKNDEHFVISSGMDAGNKGIYNLGKLIMVGEEISSKMTRLSALATAGDLTIDVDSASSFNVGDRIGIAPTQNNPDHYDIREITDISGMTITLNEALSFSHHGAAAGDYSFTETGGIDIRGEVVRLSRNIRIEGEDVESWGCQIVTTDAVDDDGIELSGQLYMDGVQMYNCSQMDTEKAAIRIEYKVFEDNLSVVKNSVIESGNGWGLIIRDSNLVDLDNNVVFNHFNIGFRVISSSDINIRNNFAGAINEREFFEQSMLLDVRGNYILGGGEGETDLVNTVATDNIAAGGVYAGFIAPGYACGESSNAMM